MLIVIAMIASLFLVFSLVFSLIQIIEIIASVPDQFTFNGEFDMAK